jgi:hypothetical protein
MSTGHLFLSFWDICLDNLPEGNFARRRILAADAKQQIEQARRQGRLLCLSEDDLVAPYHAHKRDNHAALCCLLESDFGIPLNLEDFIPEHTHGSDSFYSVLPLNGVRVQGSDRMLVVNCSYRLRESSLLDLELDPATAEFHLIEAISQP